MATISKITTAFLVGLFSCSSNDTTHNTTASIDTIKSDTVKNLQTAKKSQTVTSQTLIPDTIKRFIVDDYPLTDDMFGRDINGREIKSGGVISVDKVWFTNDTLRQTIVVELYTDNFRMAEFHFQNQDIPKGLIKRMELHVDAGDFASQQQKEKKFKGFIATATKISKKYFTTDKGFKLGDHKLKAVNIYGKPDKKTIENDIEVLEWDFEGDILYDGKTNLKGKPLAKDNYGHQTTMFFKGDKLIAIIFHNDIP